MQKVENSIAVAFPASPKPWRGLLLLTSTFSLLMLLTLLWPAEARAFPAAWNLGLRGPIDAFQDWVIGNRAAHPAFVFGFEPLSAFIDGALRLIEGALLALGWPVVLLLFGLQGALAGGWRLALLCAGGFLLAGLFGLWAPTLQTLALMTCALLLAVAVGVPLGVLAAASDRFDRALRPLLDAMQTMPAFVYLIPVLLFFGVARVPAVVATLIYALPPVIRLTALGIRQASPPAVEAARAFGATPWQLLAGVQLPLALPSILAGVNQTIMMALGMVVIAAMIGAGGLGREVLVALQRLNVGQALEAGPRPPALCPAAPSPAGPPRPSPGACRGRWPGASPATRGSPTPRCSCWPWPPSTPSCSTAAPSPPPGAWASAAPPTARWPGPATTSSSSPGRSATPSRSRCSARSATCSSPRCPGPP
jgi:glycine betaine/proline transport system permease protein